MQNIQGKINRKSLNKLYKKRIIITIATIIVITIIIFAAITPNFGKKDYDLDNPKEKQANWTCLFYFAGDNNLADFNEMLTNLEFLQRVGSTDNVNMICLLDRNGPDDTKVFFIEKGNLEEIPLSTINTSWGSEVNMGDPAVLSTMAIWTFTTYPADNQMILLSNHGGGWRGICWDDTSDGDNLDLEDLKSALSDYYNHFGRRLDLLATEACLVGIAEFVYPLRDYIDFFIGSEAFSFGAENTTEGGFLVGNWQYDLMWRDLVEKPTMTPKEFGEVIIYHFKAYGPWRAPPEIPKQEASDTLSLIDASQINKVAKAVDDLAKSLKSVFPIRRERVTGALQVTEQFSGQFDFLGISYYSNIDLWDFADKVSNIIVFDDVRNSAAAVKTAVESAVLLERHGSDPTQGEHPGAHGLAIYMPQRTSEYNYNYDTIDFSKNTQWDEFIKAYWLIPA
jgi:hypothetical protein